MNRSIKHCKIIPFTTFPEPSCEVKDMTPEEIGAAIQAFLSESCPACGSEKASRMDPFCTECLDKLPRELWARVTRRDEYLQAFGPAMEYLSASFDRDD